MGASKLALLLSVCGSAVATRTVFIFGDSYTATGYNQTAGPLPSVDGNPLGNPPYPGTPWAKTPNWVDQLIVSCNQDPSSCGGSGSNAIPVLGYNFAQPGTFVNITNSDASRNGRAFPVDMVDMISQYKDLFTKYNKRFASNESLYLSFFGINDISFNGVGWTNTAWSVAEPRIKKDIADYFGLLKQICVFGGRKFVTMSVMPVARQPFVVLYQQQYKQMALNLTQLWNSEMQSQAQSLLSACPGASHYFYDSAPVFNNILDHPQQYGAPNATCEIKEGSGCLWFDAIHPYTVIHTALGKDVWKYIQRNLGFFQ